MEKQTRQYIIAYIDVLGTKEALTAKHTDIITVMRTVYRLLLQVFGDLGEDSKYDVVRIFSDNIMIAREVSAEIENQRVNLAHIISLVEAFQWICLFCDGFLVRGAVTLGNLFINDTFALGSGLSRAYELESQCAIFPRVIIDNRINNDLFCPTMQVTRDIDGFMFIDFISMVHDEATKKQLFEKCDEIMERHPHENCRIMQKYQWFNTYYMSHKQRLETMTS